jgi:hypothetical protein
VEGGKDELAKICNYVINSGKANYNAMKKKKKKRKTHHY